MICGICSGGILIFAGFVKSQILDSEHRKCRNHFLNKHDIDIDDIAAFEKEKFDE